MAAPSALIGAHAVLEIGHPESISIPPGKGAEAEGHPSQATARVGGEIKRGWKKKIKELNKN